MKILLVHNYYQIAGGEDAVMQVEHDLLINHGHDVSILSVDNNNINSFFSKIITMINVPFSYIQYKNVLKTLSVEKPDIVHVHNYFPRLSPSVFYACKKAKIPVVHTLHNYRAVCPTALLMHNSKINEISLKGSSWWGVTKRVYRNSFLGSFALASMIELHKNIGTWQTKVNCFIALTHFSQQKYIEAGWPSSKITVKPNFIEDPVEAKLTINEKGGYALYVGRLSEEKGIDVLLNSWKGCTLPLKIVGDGPLVNMVTHQNNNFIDYLGKLEKPKVLELIKNSDFIIMPSICYETFGMVIIEAFSCSTPVLLSKLGSLQVIVKNQVTGLHFETGNSADLTKKVQWMINNPNDAKKMGENARQEYLDKYTPTKNYLMLMGIYQKAIDEGNVSNG